MYTFKTKHMTQKIHHNGETMPVYEEISDSETTYYKWSNDNNVYTEIAHPGGIDLSNGSYMFIFAGERPTLDNSKATERLNAPRNIGYVIVSEDLSTIVSPGETETGGYYTYGGSWKPQENKGIQWLTNFDESVGREHWEHAIRVKVAKLNTDSIIFYESWLENTYLSTEYFYY